MIFALDWFTQGLTPSRNRGIQYCYAAGLRIVPCTKYLYRIIGIKLHLPSFPQLKKDQDHQDHMDHMDHMSGNCLE